MIIYFIDIGVIGLIYIILTAIVDGLCYTLVDWLSQHILLVGIICAIISLIVFIVFWVKLKKTRTSLISLIYISQLYYFVVYGLYRLNLFYKRHEIIGFFVFLVYFCYSLSNLLLLAIITEDLDYKEIHTNSFTTGETELLLFGLGGWLINYLFLIG